MSRLRRLVSATVAVLLVSGCSGDEPAADPRPASSPPSTITVTTTSPTPSPPELPAKARQNTKAGAVAFVHHFVDAANYLRRGGDAAPLRRLSSDGCESCEAMSQVGERTYANGGYLRGGRWTVKGASALPVTGPGTWQVVLDIKVAEQMYRPRAGSPIQRRRPERTTLIFSIERSTARWMVTSLERQVNG